jgi:hypothetical protein
MKVHVGTVWIKKKIHGSHRRMLTHGLLLMIKSTQGERARQRMKVHVGTVTIKKKIHGLHRRMLTHGLLLPKDRRVKLLVDQTANLRWHRPLKLKTSASFSKLTSMVAIAAAMAMLASISTFVLRIYQSSKRSRTQGKIIGPLKKHVPSLMIPCPSSTLGHVLRGPRPGHA